MPYPLDSNLPASGQISFADINSEFGVANSNVSLSSYYGADLGVPSSGSISFSNFYSKNGPMPGRMWCWGWNYDSLANIKGGIGDNTTVDKSSPVTTAGGGTNWKHGGAGATAGRGIKTDGTLWTWGANNSGQLGDGTTVDKSSPINPANLTGTTWKLISGRGTFSSAIKTDGTLWSWGYNTSGQLGNNTTTGKSSPVQPTGGGTTWKLSSSSEQHTAAIKTDGTLWSWGYNANGQLGDGTIANRSSPVQVTGGGTNWKQVGCSAYNSVAIKTDGTLWAWGWNTNGQIGNNSGIGLKFSSPVQTAAGGTNWKIPSCGTSHMASIKTDGSLWVWGFNSSGQLGDGTTVNKSSPINPANLTGTTWIQVLGGNDATSGIKSNGTLWVWGNNFKGQLGDNTTVNKSSPVTVAGGGTTWKRTFACGGNYLSSAIN